MYPLIVIVPASRKVILFRLFVVESLWIFILFAVAVFSPVSCSFSFTDCSFSIVSSMSERVVVEGVVMSPNSPAGSIGSVGSSAFREKINKISKITRLVI